MVGSSTASTTLGTEAKRRHLKGVALAEDASVDALEHVLNLAKSVHEAADQGVRSCIMFFLGFPPS